MQVHKEQGGDLGHGGNHVEEPAICLGPGGVDPASLLSLTEYTGVTWRTRPPGLVPEWGVSAKLRHDVNNEDVNQKRTINYALIFLNVQTSCYLAN